MHLVSESAPANNRINLTRSSWGTMEAHVAQVMRTTLATRNRAVRAAAAGACRRGDPWGN